MQYAPGKVRNKPGITSHCEIPQPRRNGRMDPTRPVAWRRFGHGAVPRANASCKVRMTPFRAPWTRRNHDIRRAARGSSRPDRIGYRSDHRTVGGGASVAPF